MAQSSDTIKYYITTHTSPTHNVVESTLAYMSGIYYNSVVVENEQAYSVFEVYSGVETFKLLRDLSIEHQFSINYGVD